MKIIWYFVWKQLTEKQEMLDRRWGEKNISLSLLRKLYKNYNLNSAFIGIDKSVPIPEKPYFIDLRSNLNMASLTQVLKYSKGYIGNDTGPLHLANFMKKKSIGIYFRESSHGTIVLFFHT